MRMFINGLESTLSDFYADDLKRAVINSLFSWRRAEADDEVPGISRFGWWADTFSENDRFGSRLWLLMREVLTEETLALAKEYAGEALQWLVDDAIASEVSVSAEREDLNRLNLQVEITKPDRNQLSIRFQDVWEGL